jgi:hypothetical protein
MSRALCLPAQARALRSLTGLSLPKCRRILSLVDLEFAKHRVMSRRNNGQTSQPGLDDQPISAEDAAEAFANLRRELAEGRP